MRVHNVRMQSVLFWTVSLGFDSLRFSSFQPAELKPMARPAIVKNGKQFCVNLPSKTQKEAALIARQRYGISFSMLVARLLVKEKASPKGLVHAHPRELTAN